MFEIETFHPVFFKSYIIALWYLILKTDVMRKIYLFLFSLLVSIMGYTQEVSEIKITTSKVWGDSFDMWPKSTSKEDAIIVDWGDGTKKEYNIDPEASGYYTKVSGKIVGDTIRVFTKLTELDCADGGVVSLTLTGQPLLEKLLLNKNELTSDKCDFNGAINLTYMDVSNNKLTVMDMRAFEKLEFFVASNNENLSTVLFADGSTALQQISMLDCDISHFYPVELPNLSSLSLANNSLIDIEIAGHYPKLSSLDISGNYINEIDVTSCKELELLNCSNNQFSKLNVAHCPKLLNLFCSDNHLSELNLVNNPLISNLSCNNNNLAKLDVSMLPNLTSLSCEGNQLKSLDVSKNLFLKTIVCADNLFDFLDFTNNSRLTKVDCRNNHNMTACSVNYMFSTLWALDREVWSANLLIEGCNAEGADASEITSSDYKWKTDITCDGSVKCDSVVITLTPSEHGTYRLEQPTQYGQNYKEITTKAMVGTPVKVVAKPEEDYSYKSVEVNDVEITDTLFCPKEASLIKVNFKSNRVPYITINVNNNTDMSFALAAEEENTPVTIDWGDGALQNYEIGEGWKRIDGNSAGTTVTITGAVIAANFESYPGMGIWDNQLKGIDISHNNDLVWLSTYMNPIQSLSVSNCSGLLYLDCAYCELSQLNVTENRLLTNLICYGNEIADLDVSQNESLEELNVKNNHLTELNLAHNLKLIYVDAQNNLLESIDVTTILNLEKLYVSGNKLSTIDLTHNTKLWDLAISNNNLSVLDVSKNPLITKLLCENNRLAALDLINQPELCYLNCGGNGMSACALNDLYYSLPQYPVLEEPIKGYTLWVKGMDGNMNDAEHAESLIAKGKGWTINYEGDGSGCNEAYVTIKEAENGSVRLLDKDKNEVLSGDKVEKNSVVTIESTPAEGYELESVKANGVRVQDNRFIVDRATEVVAKFMVVTGMGSQSETVISVSGEQGAIYINAPVSAEICVYSMSGIQVFSGTVIGEESIRLPAGNYIVSVSESEEKVSKILVVY